MRLYLEDAIGLSGTVELYNGEDYWEPPLQRRAVSVQDLRGERFVFEERELLTVTKDVAVATEA